MTGSTLATVLSAVGRYSRSKYRGNTCKSGTVSASAPTARSTRLNSSFVVAPHSVGNI